MEKTSNVAIPATDDSDRINRFIWSAFSLSNHLHEIRQEWAKQLGVSGPQWLILFAIMSDDNGNGVPVGRLAEKLHVKSTFVTAQTKLLEERGMVVRTVSPADRRVTLLSVATETQDIINAGTAERNSVHRYIFGGLTEVQFTNLVSAMELIEDRAGQARSSL
jgi:DNA-binding MarR family transcriptional regulator